MGGNSIKSAQILFWMFFSYLDLQMTDVELDDRMTALDENGSGSNQNGNVLKFEFIKVGLHLTSLDLLDLINANIG